MGLFGRAAKTGGEAIGDVTAIRTSLAAVMREKGKVEEAAQKVLTMQAQIESVRMGEGDGAVATFRQLYEKHEKALAAAVEAHDRAFENYARVSGKGIDDHTRALIVNVREDIGKGKLDLPQPETGLTALEQRVAELLELPHAPRRPQFDLSAATAPRPDITQRFGGMPPEAPSVQQRYGTAPPPGSQDVAARYAAGGLPQARPGIDIGQAPARSSGGIMAGGGPLRPPAQPGGTTAAPAAQDGSVPSLIGSGEERWDPLKFLRQNIGEGVADNDVPISEKLDAKLAGYKEKPGQFEGPIFRMPGTEEPDMPI